MLFRSGQRIINATAAQNRWPLVLADVGCAFLRGLTFQELADLEGTPVRQVCMELPKCSVPLLKMLDGYKDFSSVLETLEMLRPGFGLKDAPYAWGRRLDAHMRTMQKMYPIHADKKLYVDHSAEQPRRLRKMSSSHIDDIKATGGEDTLQRMLQLLKEAFGDLKVQWFVFECCGEHHW